MCVLKCGGCRSGVIAAKEVPERRAALDALGFDWSPDDMYVKTSIFCWGL